MFVILHTYVRAWDILTKYQVRCDDSGAITLPNGKKKGICVIDDPCDDTKKIETGVEAYADQADENGYSQINFCPPFFRLPSLGSAVAQGLASLDPFTQYDLRTYENRG